jgi:DinB family protein
MSVMPHPLVTQLRFTRSEWVRGLKRVTPEEAARHIAPINPISWMIGHLAWQEQLYFLERAQGLTPVPEVKQFGFGKPLMVPPLEDAWR